jgi:uncharacterized protein (TIGR02996 family)
VTEDEAFIRAIVDSPGEDTPRLVYADWLDEHDDPRGPYLRAEVEWAKPWRSGERPVGSPELRELARGLEPVWVARISRPPLGVCCDHLPLASNSGATQPSELAKAESILGTALPPQLRALMLNYSLGRLKGDPFVLPRGRGLSNLAVDAFVCLDDPNLPGWSVRLELVYLTEWLREQLGLDHNFLYLASMYDDIQFVVSGREQDFGSVHRTNWCEMRVTPGGGVYRFADSVGEFLSMLQTRTRPLTDTDIRTEPGPDTRL